VDTAPLLALVVDDEADSRAILARVAERADFRVVEAVDGAQAVALARELRPDMILMDISMPRMTGLEALREIREIDPQVPVVIVTAADHPEAAGEALELGAVNFVLKPIDLREIRFVVDRIRAAVREEEDLRPAMALLLERRTVLEVDNDVSVLGPAVAYLGRELRVQYPGFEVPVTEVKLALYEALANAIEHGNLEIDYDEKTRAIGEEGGVRALIERRRHDPRYASRRVRLEASYEPARVVYRIRDQGRGFPHKTEEKEHQLGDTSALHGRGILLMKYYMEEVSWNEEGTEVRLALTLKRRAAAPGPPTAGTRPTPP
jgi:DNA-binding response OmpR family regulator